MYYVHLIRLGKYRDSREDNANCFSWDHTLSVYIYSYMKNVYGFQCDLCDADYVGYSRGQETTFSVFA